jgi:hypothetical protein
MPLVRPDESLILIKRESLLIVSLNDFEQRIPINTGFSQQIVDVRVSMLIKGNLMRTWVVPQNKR